MTNKTLSDEIIGCKNCLGEWIKADKVRKFFKKLKEVLKKKMARQKLEYSWFNHFKVEETIDKLAGDKLK